MESSFTVAVLGVVLSVFAGFAFTRMNFVGSSVLFYVLLLGLTIPAEAFIIPLYFKMRSRGLTDSDWALILAQTLAVVTFWMSNQFRSFAGDILERLDGASYIRCFGRSSCRPRSRRT